MSEQKTMDEKPSELMPTAAAARLLSITPDYLRRITPVIGFTVRTKMDERGPGKRLFYLRRELLAYVDGGAARVGIVQARGRKAGA